MGNVAVATDSSFVAHVQRFMESLQDEICRGLEQLDGEKTFREDVWSSQHLQGGGRSRVLEGGNVLEKAAVHTSAVSGHMPQSMAVRFGVEVQAYVATGTSLIIHPRNPYVPTIHANYRFFELEQGDFWFGGGTDLTPYYPFIEDVKHFHAVYKKVCDRHEATYYPRFKKWCDEYFYLPHRGETRGVGGIFFDYLRGDREKLFAFVQECGRSFLESYVPIVERRKLIAYGERERWWQSIRRGRYVEFNLLYDRGTKFGLETGGRTESILASLPPLVRWEYEASPEKGSREEELLKFLSPREWL